MAYSTEVPLGITKLIELEQVSVRQKRTPISGNKYTVFSGAKDDLLMYANEDANFLSTFFGGKHRTFHIDVFDTQHKEVFRLRRPYTFGEEKMDVTVGGRLACVVREKTTFFKPVLFINDNYGWPVLKVKGPIDYMMECDFDIFSKDKKKIGVIRKKWNGFWQEKFTDGGNFEIHFPADLDVSYKCAIIGTCFLIDILYYDN